MKEFEPVDGIVEGIIKTLEEDAGEKIFTMKVLDRVEEDQLDVIVVFEESKAVMKGLIKLEDDDGKIGVRIQGNFL